MCARWKARSVKDFSHFRMRGPRSVSRRYGPWRKLGCACVITLARLPDNYIINLELADSTDTRGIRKQILRSEEKKKQLCVCAVASKIADPSDPVQKICLAVKKLFLSDKKCICSKLQLLVYLASRVPVYRLADFPSANSIPRR